MIQADLRTARMHPDYGMNGFILAAIVIAALAALGALAHVLDGLFFIRRASSAFVRFVSVWDIGFAFLGYLTCAAGLSRHRIFPWLYLGFAIGFALPRVMLEFQANGLDVGMSAMHEDQSFLQQTHILQSLALLTCLAAVYVLWSPAVRITYRHRLTRDEERLVEQMQGADPRLSRGPQGQDEALRDGQPALPGARHAGRRIGSSGRQPDAGGSDTESGWPGSTPPVASALPGGSPRDETAGIAGSGENGGGQALVRRRARRSADAPLPPPAPADPALPGAAEPLPALPSFFQPGTEAPGDDGLNAMAEPMPGPAIGRGQGMDSDQHAAALAAATVAGALKRVSESETAVPSGEPPPSTASAGMEQVGGPDDVASEPVIVRSGRRRSGASPTGNVPPAPSREAASAAAGAIIAGAQRRSDGSAAIAGQDNAWASTTSSQAAMPAAQAPEGMHDGSVGSGGASTQGAMPAQGAGSARGSAPILSAPAAAAAPPASDVTATPAPAAPANAGRGRAYDATLTDDSRHDDAMRRQLDAEEARQKLQEELEIDRRIARLRGLATGQVSALSIGLAMDRNPLAEDDEDEAPTASDGAVRSTTDERLGRLRAAAAPPRSRGDSVRRREDQSLSDSVGEVVHDLAKGDEEGELTSAASISAAAPLATPSRAAADGGFRSRIDALLSRVDASNAWQGGSLPEEVTDQAEAAGATPSEQDPEPEPSRPSEPPMAAPRMPGAAVPPHLDPHPSAGPAVAAFPAGDGRPDPATPEQLPVADAAWQPPPAMPEAQPVLAADAVASEMAQPDRGPPGEMPAPSADLPTVGEAFAGPAPGQGATDDGDSDWPAVTGEIPGLAPMSAPEAPPPAGPDPAALQEPAPAEAAPRRMATAEAVTPEAVTPEAESEAVRPEPASAEPPQAAPIDEEDLARSLAEILPAAAGPGGHPADDGGAVPARPSASAPQDEAMTAAAAGSPTPAGTGGAPQPGGRSGEDGAASDAAAASDAPSPERGADDDPQIDQRIDAMRILVDEGFMSAEEFEKRSVALRSGG